MAAFFVFKDGTQRIWHVGYRPFNTRQEIKEIDYVQVDGDEAELIYDLDMDLKGRVHQLSHNVSVLYCLFIYSLYYKN